MIEMNRDADLEIEKIRRNLDRIRDSIEELNQRSETLEKRIDAWYRQGLPRKRGRKKKKRSI